MSGTKRGILIILQLVLIIFIFSLWIINSSNDAEQSTEFKNETKNTVKLETIEFPSFELGNLNTIKVSAYNYLENDVFNGVADFLVVNQDNMTVSTSGVEIPIMYSNSSIQLSTNWDTKNIKSGNYTVKVKLNYHDKMQEKDYFVSVNPSSVYLLDSAEFSSIHQETKKKSSFSTTLMVIVVLLVMIDVYVTVKMLKK
jgi:hypothetical protein